MDEPLELTTGDLARESRCAPETIREYERLGLIPSKRLANGTRLFSRSAVAIVAKVKAERSGNKGRKAA